MSSLHAVFLMASTAGSPWRLLKHCSGLHKVWEESKWGPSQQEPSCQYLLSLVFSIPVQSWAFWPASGPWKPIKTSIALYISVTQSKTSQLCSSIALPPLHIHYLRGMRHSFPPTVPATPKKHPAILSLYLPSLCCNRDYHFPALALTCQQR